MSKNKNGWIKIHRRVTEKGYYKNSQYIHLWLHLLLNANHETKEFMWNKEIIMIKEGQLLTGRKELSEQTGISETTIERILKMFESEHQIGQQKTTKFRIITILNWTNYQLNRSERTTKRTTDGQQTDTNKKDKKEKNNITFLLPVELEGKITQDLWTDWIEYREEIKKPLTEISIKKQVGFLIQQPDPSECINSAIRNHWQGLFEVTNNKSKSIVKTGSQITAVEFPGGDAFGEFAK